MSKWRWLALDPRIPYGGSRMRDVGLFGAGAVVGWPPSNTWSDPGCQMGLLVFLIATAAMILAFALAVVGHGRHPDVEDDDALFRHVGQPPVIGDTVAGILLGPSFLGLVAPGVSGYVLPPSVAPYFSVLAQVGVIFYMFSSVCIWTRRRSAEGPTPPSPSRTPASLPLSCSALLSRCGSTPGCRAATYPSRCLRSSWVSRCR